jgi:hypothetical protein
LSQIEQGTVVTYRTGQALLAEFEASGAEQSFEEIVRLYAGMVYSVCQQVTKNAHDAEDAAQATFLALLRATIRDGAAVASWLHSVAVRVSLSARREAGRRRVRERAAAVPEATRPREPDDWDDTMVAVHREVALLPDALLDPATYFFPAGLVLGFNEKVDWLEAYRTFVESSADPYADARLAWTLLRNTEALDFQWESEQTAAVQTLQAVLLAPKDEGFATRLLHGSVIAPGTGRSLPFSYRLQPDAAPIVYVLPGLGSHRLGSSAVALAELAWERGFSVVVISNALNFEFMSCASSVPVPGHAPIDARDVYDVLDAVDRQLDGEFPGRITKRVLMGYSLGAFHAFFIAAAEQEPGNQRVRFDRYLTLDAPVSLMEGLRQLDGFYDAPLVYPPEQRDTEVRRILYKAVTVGKHLLAERERYSRSEVARSGADASWLSGLEVPLTDLEARFLIGLAFRRTLRELIWTSQQRQDLGVLRTPRRSLVRNPAYEEIGDYSYEEYLYAFVFPYLRDRGIVDSAEELVAANDLHSLEAALRANGRIRHFANSNDFLTTDDDEAWLVDVLGREHVKFFPEGGHLGNLHRPEVQAQIMDAIADLLPSEAPAQ